MKKPNISEKLFLQGVIKSAQSLFEQQRGLEIGQLITLIREQLGMSQRTLAKRAGMPQETISIIESGNRLPSLSTLRKIFNALECDMILSAIPRDEISNIREKQALKKARMKMQYLQGTMSLEKQTPDEELLEELVKEEARRLLESSGSELWGDEL